MTDYLNQQIKGLMGMILIIPPHHDRKEPIGIKIARIFPTNRQYSYRIPHFQFLLNLGFLRSRYPEYPRS